MEIREGVITPPPPPHRLFVCLPLSLSLCLSLCLKARRKWDYDGFSLLFNVLS